MVSLEQVKLLETKIVKIIDYVKKVTEENTFLKKEVESYQKRVDEFEAQIKQFKEDQARIEEGLLSALDRLNQFEDALESKLTQENAVSSSPDPVDPVNPSEQTAPPEHTSPTEDQPKQEDPQGSDNDLDIF